MDTSERMLVLELLRDGKVTSDDAEKLLRALGGSSREDTREDVGPEWRRVVDRLLGEVDTLGVGEWRRRLNSLLDEMASTMADFRSSTCGSSGVRDTDVVIHDSGRVQIAESCTVIVSQKGGNLSLTSAEGDTLDIKAVRCRVTMSDGGAKADLESTGNDLTLAIPSRAGDIHVLVKGGRFDCTGVSSGSLVAEVVGGSARIADTTVEVDLTVTGAEANISGATGSRMSVDAHGAGVVADLGDVTSGRFVFSSIGGDVRITLGERSEFGLRYDVSGGVLESEWDSAPAGENRVRVGDGGAEFRVSASGGSVRLRKRASDNASEASAGGSA